MPSTTRDVEVMRRRTDDIHQRLDSQDINHRKLETAVAEGNADTKLLKVEVQHQAQMLTLRLDTMQKSADEQARALEEILKKVAAMGEAPANTPAGRELHQALTTLADEVTKAIAALSQAQKETETRVQKIDDWMTRADSIISIFRWMGAANVLLFILLIGAMAKILWPGVGL